MPSIAPFRGFGELGLKAQEKIESLWHFQISAWGDGHEFLLCQFGFKTPGPGEGRFAVRKPRGMRAFPPTVAETDAPSFRLFFDVHVLPRGAGSYFRVLWKPRF